VGGTSRQGLGLGAAWSVSAVSGSGAGPYTITLTGGSTPSTGTVTLRLNASRVIDPATNPSPPSASDAPVATTEYEITNTALPTTSGQTKVGSRLASTEGSWTYGPTSWAVAYRWQVSDDGSTGWSDIATSATSSTFTITQAQLWKYLRVKVTASNAWNTGAGAVVVHSAPTARIGPGDVLLAPA
jgi:hypothetical protein